DVLNAMYCGPAPRDAVTRALDGIEAPASTQTENLPAAAKALTLLPRAAAWIVQTPGKLFKGGHQIQAFGVVDYSPKSGMKRNAFCPDDFYGPSGSSPEAVSKKFEVNTEG